MVEDMDDDMARTGADGTRCRVRRRLGRMSPWCTTISGIMCRCTSTTTHWRVLDDRRILVWVDDKTCALRAYDPETCEGTDLATLTGSCVVGLQHWRNSHAWARASPPQSQGGAQASGQPPPTAARGEGRGKEDWRRGQYVHRPSRLC